MRTHSFFGALVLVAAATVGRPAVADNVTPGSLVFSGNQDALFGPALTQTDAPAFAGSPMHLESFDEAAAPGGFDPSQMRVFGGELGGEGVMGGAVVSLSWATK